LFDDGALAGVDHVDLRLADIHADDGESFFRKTRGRNAAYVAEAEYAYRL
jgi:hypothetical protein